MENQFGIVQGRLTQSPNNELQWFPQDSWRQEFEIAENLGFNFIELLIERENNKLNPLWSSEGREEILSLSERYNNHILSYCTDYIISNSIFDRTTLDHTLHVLDIGLELGMKKLILPFFEASEISINNYKNFKEIVEELSSRASGMTICLETNLRGAELSDALTYYNRPNVGCVFDTGNRIAFGHDIYNDILILSELINHVHIKDKNKNNENVLLGTGLVNFYDAFKSFSKINYKGSYTFETTRGKTPAHTAKFNLGFAQYFINEVQ